MYNGLPDAESVAAARGIEPHNFSRQAAFWWGYHRPRLALHTSVLFCLLFYLLPLHMVIAYTAPYFPFLRGRIAAFYDATGFNLPFLIVMVALWALIYLLLWAVMQVVTLRGDLESETAVLAAAINYSNGLTGLQRAIIGTTVCLVTILTLLGISGLSYGVLSAAVIAGIALGSLRPTLKDRKRGLDSDEIEAHINQTEEALSMEGDVVRKTYEWYFDERPGFGEGSQIRFEITVPISSLRYEEFRSMPHEVRHESDYARFVLEGTVPEVALVGDHLRRIGVQRGYSSFQNACNALAFTRQFHYASDKDTTGQPEYFRYPIEMLWDEIGDCDCHAILAATLLRCLGFDVILLALDFSDANVGHLAVGVAGADDMPADDNYYEDPATGVRYFYCEATPPSGRATDEPGYIEWRVGRLPFDNVTRVTPIPLRGEIMVDAGY